jgi:hypothetical protein
MYTQKGYIDTTGKTPVRTMGYNLYSDVKKKRERSRFVKLGHGYFTLADWARNLTITLPTKRKIKRKTKSTETTSKPKRRKKRRAIEQVDDEDELLEDLPNGDDFLFTSSNSLDINRTNNNTTTTRISNPKTSNIKSELNESQTKIKIESENKDVIQNHRNLSSSNSGSIQYSILSNTLFKPTTPSTVQSHSNTFSTQSLNGNDRNLHSSNSLQSLTFLIINDSYLIIDML